MNLTKPEFMTQNSENSKINNQSDNVNLLIENILKVENNKFNTLINDNPDYYQLLNAVITLLENKNFYESDNTENKKFKKLIKLLYTCILAIFSDATHEIKSTKNITLCKKDQVNYVFNFNSCDALLTYYFSVIDNYVFNNFIEYACANDDKTFLIKIMNYIPISELEYFADYCIRYYTNSIIIDFVNEKIRSGKKSEVNNLIYKLLNSSLKLLLIRNSDNSIFIIEYSSIRNKGVYTKIINEIEYICYTKDSQVLIISELEKPKNLIRNYNINGNILKFSIDYYSHMVYFEVDLVNFIVFKK